MRTNLTNEIGMLNNNFALMAETVSDISNEMSGAFAQMNEGNMSTRINADKYEGTYRNLAETGNEMLENTSGEFRVISQIISEYAKGNFEHDVPRFPGEKAMLHNAADEMKMQLINIDNSINDIIADIRKGKLETNINAADFSGSWYNIIE